MDYSPTDMMTVAAARSIRNCDVCFVGIGMPSAACNLARMTHAPDVTLIYESGTIGTKPEVLPLLIKWSSPSLGAHSNDVPHNVTRASQ